MNRKLQYNWYRKKSSAIFMVTNPKLQNNTPNQTAGGVEF